MINALVNGIFNLILSMFNAILSPFISAITVLFPAVGTYFSYISTFVGYACTYVGLILDLFMIPRSCIVALFDYFLITYSIYILSLSIKFALNIYNKLKI